MSPNFCTLEEFRNPGHDFLEGRILTTSETRDLLAAKTGFVFKERQTSKVEKKYSEVQCIFLLKEIV